MGIFPTFFHPDYYLKRPRKDQPSVETGPNRGSGGSMLPDREDWMKHVFHMDLWQNEIVLNKIDRWIKENVKGKVGYIEVFPRGCNWTQHFFFEDTEDAVHFKLMFSDYIDKKPLPYEWG